MDVRLEGYVQELAYSAMRMLVVTDNDWLLRDYSRNWHQENLVQVLGVIRSRYSELSGECMQPDYSSSYALEALALNGAAILAGDSVKSRLQSVDRLIHTILILRGIRTRGH